MANLNKIILVGRLTADPEARSTVDGLAVTKFRLAVNRPVSGGNNVADFFDIVAWRRLAEICGQYLKKGQLALVEGRIQNRSFEDASGQKRWVTEVIARNMTMLEKGKELAKTEPAMAAPDEAAPEVEDDELFAADDPASDLPF